VTPYFSIQESEELYEGKSYFRMVSSPSVILCVLDSDDCFICVRQFRPNLGYITLEFPAGGMEGAESPLEAANRELLEETGLRADLLSLGSFRLQMNRTVNKEYLFFGLVTERKSVQLKPEITGDCQVVKVPRQAFLGKMRGNVPFEQLAGFGIIQLASLLLETNFVSASYREIVESVKKAQENNL